MSITLRPEIERLRALLERVEDADDPATIDTEVKVSVRLVDAIVRAAKADNEMHPVDDAGVNHSLAGILERAAAVVRKGGGHGPDA
jgi:hypothetical protein